MAAPCAVSARPAALPLSLAYRSRLCGAKIAPTRLQGAAVSRSPGGVRVLASTWGSSASGQQQYGSGGSAVPPQQQQAGYYPPLYQQPPPDPAQLDAAQKDALSVGTALRNIGWLAFWSQLALTLVSTTILLFSTGVTAPTGEIQFNPIDIATLFGIVCGYISTFLAWSYIQAGRRMGMLQNVRLSGIAGTVAANSNLNLLGLGATIVSLQAIVGSLVTKTLSSASAGAYYGAQRAPPPVAFDVFSVQACTNTIMAHFVGILFANWILRVVNKFQRRSEEREAKVERDYRDAVQALEETLPSAPPMPSY